MDDKFLRHYDNNQAKSIYKKPEESIYKKPEESIYKKFINDI